MTIVKTIFHPTVDDLATLSGKFIHREEYKTKRNFLVIQPRRLQGPTCQAPPPSVGFSSTREEGERGEQKMKCLRVDGSRSRPQTTHLLVFFPSSCFFFLHICYENICRTGMINLEYVACVVTFG